MGRGNGLNNVSRVLLRTLGDRDGRLRWNTPPLLLGAGIICLALLALLLFFVLRDRRPPPRVVPEAPPPPASQLQTLVFPTVQDLLAGETSPDVFQPTESGRLVSALYGSTRTASSGRPKFHEGVDIAAAARDSQHRPLDEVRAVADGRVAYINSVAGSSSYGIYAVIEHMDPLGPVHSLYAHLASVDSELKPGLTVTHGRRIGVVGHTSTLGIPLSRAHLHFEIGLIANHAFPRFIASPHGIYNGLNLFGLSPLDVFKAQREHGRAFTMLDFVRATPPAFRLLLRSPVQLDYFRTYAPLWNGPAFNGDAMILSVSESGVPLSGRNARPDESRGTTTHAVIDVDEAVLGRNGKGLITERGTGWRLSSRGERWLRTFTTRP